MGDWGTWDSGQRLEDEGTVAATSLLTTVTGNVSANTKGAYTQLVASTGFDAKALEIVIESFDLGQAYLVDVAIGAAASEQVIVSDIPFTPLVSAAFSNHISLPFQIPAATRIAARCQDSAGGGNRIRVQATIIGGGFPVWPLLGKATTYGVNEATSLASAVDCGGVANTKGAWTQLTATTTSVIRWGVICCQCPTSPTGSASYLLDLGVGGAGSEQVIVPNRFLIPFVSGTTAYPTYFSLPMAIPKGTRVAARAQCTSAVSTDRVVNVSLIGVG